MVWHLNKAAEDEKREMEELEKNDFGVHRHGEKRTPRPSYEYPDEQASTIRTSTRRRNSRRSIATESSRRDSGLNIPRPLGSGPQPTERCDGEQLQGHLLQHPVICHC